MHYTEARTQIGQSALWDPAVSCTRSKPGTDLLVRVRILDVKWRYGRLDYLIEPDSGSGTRWVMDSQILRLELGC